MKTGIHPKYNVIKVKCSTCGFEHEVGTTAKDFRIDTCSNCHPFYTGQQSFIQVAGRVERFNKRYGINAQQAQDNQDKKDNE
ncbi:MAG: 50S ribosomal protein L31 [Acholeplasmataceae bacterium]|nr:50S ribosomal protein L31 [Acholeplasmataceae bacterium]